MERIRRQVEIKLRRRRKGKTLKRFDHLGRLKKKCPFIAPKLVKPQSQDTLFDFTLALFSVSDVNSPLAFRFPFEKNL